MIRFIVVLISLLLLTSTSYSQNTQTLFNNKIVIIEGDTNFFIPSWRLKEANKKFIDLDLANETISSLELLLSQWKNKSSLQSQQLNDLSLILNNKNLEIEALNKKIGLKEQLIGLTEDEIKHYKKKNKILKVTLGASVIGLIGITTLAIIN